MDSTHHKRALLLCVGLVAVFSLLSVRLVYLQVVMHDKFTKIAHQQHIRKIELQAKRGSISDRNGELLACNQTVYTVVADKNHLNDYNIACRGLAKAEGISAREVRRKYDREEIKERYLTRVVRVLAHPLDYHGWELRHKLEASDHGEIVLRKEVEESSTSNLKELVTVESIGGVYFRESMRRYYPSPQTLTHVLGHVNHEGVGQEGVELALDDMMRGTQGHRYIERDRRGSEITAFRGETLLPRDGHSVQLTIDMGLQNIVESALSDAWFQYRPEKISAVFLDPNTGEILAMSNRPHFDLSSREGERRNCAVADRYEPGSTFKIVTAAAVLDRRLVNRHTEVYCHQGSYSDGGITISDHHPYGMLSTEMILVKSSNIGAYKLAKQLGKNGLFDYMERFGFGERTGIRLSSESGGRIFPPSMWSATSFSRMAIGYEVSVTPLQMANALAVIANGGELMRPYIVDSVVDAKGRVLEKRHPEVVRRVVSERAANEVRKMLIGVVGPGGTGEKGAVEGFSVAGKTGTARKYGVKEKHYLAGRYVVSFMGFLPAEDPQLLGIVVVDDPRTGSLHRYGGTVAAPVFSRIATEAAAYLNLNASYSGENYAGGYGSD